MAHLLRAGAEPERSESSGLDSSRNGDLYEGYLSGLDTFSDTSRSLNWDFNFRYSY